MRAKGAWTYVTTKFQIRLVYARITLTRFTTCYFCFGLAYLIVQIILQSLTFQDNAWVVNSITSALSTTNATENPSFVSDGLLKTCSHGIPGQPNENCTTLVDPMDNDPMKMDIAIESARSLHAPRDLLFSVDDLSGECTQTLFWLRDLFADSKREDVVTMAFQLWLFTTSFIAILNESIPHLITVAAGHVLDTAWASFRIKGTRHLQYNYNTYVRGGACDGLDVFRGWWKIRIEHAIPILVFNCVALVALSALSLKLYRVYERQTFTRVGPSPQINRVYRLVLFFSASLQLASFFLMASTGIWIDKATAGVIRHVADHLKIYQAAYIVTALFILPWLILGWTTVRKENRFTFILHMTTGAVIAGIWIAMFSSPLYRFTFNTWPFFATVTITSFVFLTSSIILAIMCRTNFGKGLSQYLQVQDALEGDDFTPVYFANDPSRAEKGQDDYLDSDGFPATLKIMKVDKPPSEVLDIAPPARTRSSWASRFTEKRLSMMSAISSKTSRSRRTDVASSISGSSEKRIRPPPPAYSPSTPVKPAYSIGEEPASVPQQGTRHVVALPSRPVGLPANPRAKGLPSNPRAARRF